MSLLPTFQRINGNGKPRIIVLKSAAIYTSTTGTTYTSNTVVETGSPSFSMIRAGMRVSSYQTRSGKPDLLVYGKITAVNDTTDTITVSEWVGGMPTNGKAFAVDGWVIDLPYCYALLETFKPDLLIHNLYRSRKVAKLFGWEYSATLDYSKHISADTLINLDPALNMGETDELILIPRVDKPGNCYRVIYGGAVNIQRYGLGDGHSGVVLAFAGCENVAWPIPTAGYGFQYAAVYGTQL